MQHLVTILVQHLLASLCMQHHLAIKLVQHLLVPLLVLSCNTFWYPYLLYGTLPCRYTRATPFGAPIPGIFRNGTEKNSCEIEDFV